MEKEREEHIRFLCRLYLILLGAAQEARALLFVQDCEWRLQYGPIGREIE
jgi:hypothetical protein